MKDRLLAQLGAIDAVLRERQREAIRAAIKDGRDSTPYSEAVHFMRFRAAVLRGMVQAGVTDGADAHEIEVEVLAQCVGVQLPKGAVA